MFAIDFDIFFFFHFFQAQFIRRNVDVEMNDF